jgi:hypothetical protein
LDVVNEKSLCGCACGCSVSSLLNSMPHETAQDTGLESARHGTKT